MILDMPKKTPTDPKVTVAARVTPAVADALQTIADRERRTVSQIIEFAIDEYLERHGKPKAK